MHVDVLRNSPKTQMQWIANNRIKENIRLVTFVGDYVSYGNSLSSWNTAASSLSPLLSLRGTSQDPFNNLSVAFATGNHDYNSYFQAPVGQPRGWRKTDASSYKSLLGKNKWLNYSWFKEDLNDENHVQLIPIGEDLSIVHIDVEWDIGNSATKTVTGIDDSTAQKRLDWLKQTINRYKNYPVMITTHEYLSETGTLTAAGKKIWNAISQYPNIFMINSGHLCQVSDTSGTGSAFAKATRSGKGPVLQFLTDYQNFRRNLTWTRQVRFQGTPENLTVSWRTFSVNTSPYTELTDSKSKNSVKIKLSDYFGAETQEDSEDLMNL
jgi:hypothetical protein